MNTAALNTGVMRTDVLIVGAGPAGLAAAIELRRLGVQDVLVVDREREAGGVPRHCAHTGFGLRDLHRVMGGPAYARHYRRAAARAGAVIRTQTTLTGWTDSWPGQSGPVAATLTSPAGIETVHASSVLLATGCRERPRAARLVPGSRPPGVYTTGELQQRVYLHGQRLTGRAVIVGAEHVSFSAMLTLAHAGADVVGMVTEQPRHQSLAAFRLGARFIWRVPLWTQTTVTEILGGDQVSAVRLRDHLTGTDRVVSCDLVVFSADWIPDAEHARLAGAQMDPASHGPVVDTTLRTSLPWVFAAGNLVHAAETADIAAISGRHAAIHMWRSLVKPADATTNAETPVLITAVPPLQWISPGAIRVPGWFPARHRFVLRSAAYLPAAHLEVRQDDELLYRERARLMPGRSLQLAADWVKSVSPSGGPVHVSVR
jgi:thioredoxin reductase